jgi:hypothetical protein
MRAVCIDNDVDGLTLGKYYDIIEQGSHPDSIHTWYKDWFLIKNDSGEIKWYDRCPYGILKILPATNMWGEYIGQNTGGLTKGIQYNLLHKSDREFYYFLDDNKKFVGIRQINYFGGDPNFRVLEKDEVRDKNINDILSI